MITSRKLGEDDWECLRDLRLHALRTEPGWFCRSYAEEITISEGIWRDRLRTPDSAIFGFFDSERLVGITGAVTDRDDPTGRTAMLVMSYLDPGYRGRGIGRSFYSVRLAWIRAQPQFERAIVSHRAANAPSAAAARGAGFVRIGARPATWPDGTEDDEILYELRIR